MNFDELPDFQKDFSRLKKKYKSLKGDLSEFQKVLSAVPLGNSKHFNIITKNEVLCIIKARLFCRYLKGSSLRVIYAYFKQEQRIKFIEVYYKGNKEKEDRSRIIRFLEEYQS